MIGNGMPPGCVAVAKSKRSNMKPGGLEFLHAAMCSVAAAKVAEPFSRELRDALEHGEQLLAALIAEAEEQWGSALSSLPARWSAKAAHTAAKTRHLNRYRNCHWREYRSR
jgi:hypothetical protein